MRGDAVQSYLSRIGADATVDRRYGWHSLFIGYSSAPPPESYRDVFTRFPEMCQLDRHPFLGFRLVLVMASPALAQVLESASKFSCRRLFHDLSDQLRCPPSPVFKLRDAVWTDTDPKIMGILNITPDSFYDGGRHYEKSDYVSLAGDMIAAGADIIDIGGESTRPGSQPVCEQEELRRVLPALRQIRGRYTIPISVDTVKPVVAEEALQAGADLVNDVSGLQAGKAMLDVVNRYRGSYCLMHTQGKPETMQKDPRYCDTVAEVYAFFRQKLEFCEAHGLERDRILLDPGIGFGKAVDHNLDLLRFLSVFSGLRCLVLQGSSQKSFIGALLNRNTEQRLSGTLATQTLGWGAGATVFRVHHIAENRDAVRMAAIYGRGNR